MDRLTFELKLDVERETLVLDTRFSEDAAKLLLKDIYTHQRKIAGKTRLFVMNAVDEWREGIIHHSAASAAKFGMRFVLTPNGSLMFDIDGDQVELPLGGEMIELNETAFKEFREATNNEITTSSKLDLSGGWLMLPQAQNVLNLTHWHFWEEDPRLKNTAYTSGPFLNVLEEASPDRENEYWAFSRFYSQGTVTETNLVFDQSCWEGECIIKVNGSTVPDAAKVRRYDVNNREVDITNLVRQGDGDVQLNWVELHFPSGGRLLEPLRLFGDFHVNLPYTGLPP